LAPLFALDWAFRIVETNRVLSWCIEYCWGGMRRVITSIITHSKRMGVFKTYDIRLNDPAIYGYQNSTRTG
jgi:hypothetical protein